MLEAENITVGYGQRVVLSGLSLAIEPGRVTAFIGPNGSGKSTLLRCLAGALRPSKGSIMLGGSNLYHMAARQSARLITYVPQETPMPFAFTVAELVSLAMASGGDETVTENTASEVMSVLDLEPLAHSALNTLSGGEQQRATIARGLTQRTDCLLLDEPTAHLDLRYQAALFGLLRKRCRESGATIVVVLHDLALAARHADRVILLYQGRVAGAGPVAEVFTEVLLQSVYGVPLAIRWENERVTSVAPSGD